VQCEGQLVSRAFSVGTGSSGQLGDKFADALQKSMFRVAGWYGFETIAQVSAGSSYSLSITTTGVVHGFG
jgi:alpha-tubulin suppressor-like RCC1 family protein